MIAKIHREETSDKYNLIITDKNGNSFTMLVGGNLDLYWVPENHRKNKSFEIDKSDEIVYSIFDQLFNAIKKEDNKYKPTLKDNTFTFISEDWPEDEANTLTIEKKENSFQINFIKNENTESWSFPHRNCVICFCNNGSRVPEVELLFMQMFNYLAYNCDLIESIDDKSM